MQICAHINPVNRENHSAEALEVIDQTTLNTYRNDGAVALHNLIAP